MRSSFRISALVVIGALVVCAGHQSPAAATISRADSRGLEVRSESAAARCPVTLPSRWNPPPGVSRRALFGSNHSFGNGRLWVGGLGESGIIKAGPQLINKDGSISLKFGWWQSVRGDLRISGRRLGGTAAPLRADVLQYGMTGFQASGVTFSTEGCWKVTGRVGAVTLRFVTLLIKRSA